MKKCDVVKSNKLFNTIINKGFKIKNKYYIVYYLKKECEFSNFGIAVGTKVGNAVIRNKIKRQLRNIVDDNRKMFPNFYNYIIICRKEILELTYNDMSVNLISLLRERFDEK